MQSDIEDSPTTTNKDSYRVDGHKDIDEATYGAVEDSKDGLKYPGMCHLAHTFVIFFFL